MPYRIEPFWRIHLPGSYADPTDGDFTILLRVASGRCARWLEGPPVVSVRIGMRHSLLKRR